MGQLVALLRGINVGGKHKVPMAELRELVEGLGHTEVRTYINSGNLIFTATGSGPALAGELEQCLHDHFGFAIPVMIRTVAQLRTLVGRNPYPDGDPKQVTVAFVADQIPTGAETRLSELATDQERFTLHPGEVFIDFGGGLARSKLANSLNRVLGVQATTRNVRTIEKILELVDA